MAKKPKVNKTQAVRDYLKANPQATPKETAAALTKKGIKITASHVSNIKSQAKAKRRAKKVLAKPVAVVAAPEPVVAEKKAADTVTFAQVKAVTQTVQAIGGFARLNELLGLVKEVGGLKKFKDLLEAMSMPETDKIPF
jgi:hypothetical protein